MKSPFTNGEADLHYIRKELEFRKDSFSILHFFYKCHDTGEEFTTDDIDQVNVTQLYNQYREKYGVPFPDEIREIREQYGLSAVKMSEVLGFGVNSYRQYESGDIPTVASGRLIQAAKDPQEFKKFLTDSKAVLSDREYTRFMGQVNKLIAEQRDNVWDNLFTAHIFPESKPNEFTGYRKPSLDRIAHMIAFFSEHMRDLWKTKLNKLLFYGDFLHYKRTGFSISGSTYRAVPFGPVPSQYDKLYIKLKDDELVDVSFIEFDNGNYGEAISAKVKFDDTLFLPSELQCLHDVVSKFEPWNTKQLVEASHQEKGWAENNDARQLISYQKYAFDLKML